MLQKSFRKKINKQTQNCPDDLKYNATELYPSQPPYAEFFLRVLIFICENLFLFMVACENLDHL